MELYLEVIIGVIIVIIAWVIMPWKPRYGIWYRNTKKSFNMGHLQYLRSCYIVRGRGKPKRGSFKVIGNKVRYIVGWGYRKNKVKTILKSKCSFDRTKKHTPLEGQGTNEVYETIYTMRI